MSDPGQTPGRGRWGRHPRRVIVIAVALVLVGAALTIVQSTRHNGPGTSGKPNAASGATQPDSPTSPSPDPGGSGHMHTNPHPTPLPRCLARPSDCGWPDGSTTGVPKGTVLRSAGSTRVDVPGTVLTGLDIHGTLLVTAPDVVLRDLRVTCDQSCAGHFAIQSGKNAHGLRIVNVEASTAPDKTVVGPGAQVSLKNCNLHGGKDGVHLPTGSTLTDSYIHDLAPTASSHDDTVQIIEAVSSDITVTHNTLIPYDTISHLYNNSALICGNQCTSTPRLVFRDNLVDGGSITVRCPQKDPAGNVFADNRFGRDYRFGAASAACRQAGNEWSGNAYVDDGAPVQPMPG